MSVGRRSVITTTYILVSRLIVLVANVAVVLLVTRYLGKEGFGSYAFVMAYSLIIGALATGGTYTILIRETARDRSQAGANLAAALQVQALFTVVATTVGLLVLPFFTQDANVRRAAWISIAAADIQVLANLYMWLFTAYEDTFYMALAVILERGIFLAGIVLVVLLRLDFLMIFWVQLTSFSFKLIFCALVVRLRFTRLVWKRDRRRLVFFLRESLPLLFSTGFRTLDAQLDTLLLQLLQTAAQLGLFGAPYRIISGINIIPDSIMAGLLPALSNLVHDARDKALNLYGKVFKYFLVGSVPIAILVSALSEPLMRLLFGPDFAEGGQALRIMVWVIVFMFPNSLFQYVLTAVGKQRYETIRLALSVVAHVGVGLVFIPRLGAAGAALGMLASQACAFVVGYIYVTRVFGSYRPWQAVVKLALGAGPALAIIELWRGQSIILPLVAAAAAYLLALIALRVFEREELLLVWRALRPPAASNVFAPKESSPS
jgi:O-antigen/teichoic acid export membrane protein